MPDCLGQDLDLDLLRVLASHVEHRFFIDIGAETGSYATLLFSLGMRGVLFEPLERHCVRLAPLVEAHDSAVHQWAIDDRDGVRDLHLATDPDGNELDFFHSLEKLPAETRFRHSRSVPVTCRSIESLASDGTIPDRVGILKTDTEGNDLSVLRGLGRLRPELIVCEYFTDGLYSGWEDARPGLVVELLRARGYRRYLATKRVGEFEYCSSSPAGFLRGQWGNLFFLTDGLYDAAEEAIASFLADVESRFLARVQEMSDDRIAKEAVIQGLLAEARAGRHSDGQ